MNRIIPPLALPTRRPSRSPHFGVVALALLALLAIPAVGRAQVNDYAGIFSPTAKQQALQAIEQMKSKHQHTMLIETYASVPPEKKAALDAAANPGQRDQFFDSWIEERRRATGTTGIVLLISMNPGRVQMEVGDQTNKSGLFTSTDRQEMVPKIVDAMKAKRYDEVATIGTTSVLERMDKNVAANPAKRAAPAAGGAAAGGAASGSGAKAPAPAKSPAPSCGGLGGMSSFLCIGIAALGAFFIIRRIMAARNNMQGGPGGPQMGGPGGYNQPGYGQPGYGQPGYGQPGYGQPQQGGGFGRGLMGGVLGGLGGAWLGNQIFGNSGSQAHGAAPTDPGAAGGAAAGPDPYSAPDTGGTSSGMDFDSGGGGGGGDFGGGGDSGGGDF